MQILTIARKFLPNGESVVLTPQTSCQLESLRCKEIFGLCDRDSVLWTAGLHGIQVVAQLLQQRQQLSLGFGITAGQQLC